MRRLKPPGDPAQELLFHAECGARGHAPLAPAPEALRRLARGMGGVLRRSLLKHLWGALACAAALVSCQSQRHEASGTAPPSEREEELAIEEWRQWRDEQVDQLLAPSQHPRAPHYLDVDTVAERADRIFSALSETEHSAPEFFQRDKPPARLLANLRDFASAVRRVVQPHGRAGFTIDNEAYNRYAKPHAQLPELLASQSFLRALNDPKTYRDAARLVEARNASAPPEEQWTMLLYKSRFLKTADDATYGRFLVYVPGETQKWIQFGIATPDMKSPSPIHSFSVVAVRSTGKTQPKTESYIIDGWRSFQGDRVKINTRLEAKQGTQNCYNCHKTPVVPIHPLEEYDFDGAGRLVLKVTNAGGTPQKLNALIGDYGPPFFGGYLKPEAWGPSLGPVGRARPDHFLRTATAGLDLNAASLNRIREQMNCSKCHNMQRVAPLNYPLAAPTDVDFLDLIHPRSGETMPVIKEFIEQGWMPPDNELTPVERKGLYRALRAEYHDPITGKGLLAEWLKSSAPRQ